MAVNWDLILTFAVEYAGYFAKRTETLIDDKAVELLGAIKDDPTVRKWFLGQVESGAGAGTTPEGTLALVAEEPPAEVVEALFDGKVFKGLNDIQSVLAALREAMPYVLELIKFVRLLTGK